MLRREELVNTPLVSAVRYDHPDGAVILDEVEEVSSTHGVHFVESGWFRLGAGRKEWLLGEGSVFVTRPGAVHRYRHLPNTAPDVCLSVVFAHGFPDTYDRCPVLTETVATNSNRLQFLRWRLGSILGIGDKLALDCWTSDLIAALDVNQSAAAHKVYRPSQLRWYAERIETARTILESKYTESHALAPLAGKVFMSPFQFARVFRELVGIAPHQYLIRVRLDRALRLLRDGASVTDACYDSGFGNLSHFIHSFKRCYGCSPSTLHRRPARAWPRELRRAMASGFEG